MNKINLIYIMLMLLGIVACNDEYVAPNSFSDVSWYSPTFARQNSDYIPKLARGDYFSIADISQGEVDHKWELKNDSIFFLGGEIVRRDSLLEEKIVSGGKVNDISTDKTVHLYFPKSGVQNIRLYNTYEEEVSFKGKDTTILSVYDEKLGLHVFDHTFVVDVYHDVVANYKVYRESGDSIAFASSDTITIDIANGETLSFVQAVDSMYHITDVAWALPGAVPKTSTEDSVSVTFYSPGTFKNFTLTANRSGNGIPSGNDKVIIPLIVKVGDGDFKPVDITKVNSKALRIQLSGQSKAALTAADFTVVAKNGGDINIPVGSVTMADDNTVAVLSLDDPIYSDDEVLVSYVGSGDKAVDGRPLKQETITLAPITDLGVADTEFFGFEKETGNWINSGGAGLYDFVANPAGEPGNSAKISVKKNGATVFLDSPSMVPLQQGVKYKITYKLYLDSRTGLNNGFNVRFVPEGGAFNDPNALVSGWMAYGNTNHFKEGEWVEHSYEKVAGATGNYWLHVRAGQGNADDYGVFYIDDINVEVVDSRP